MRCITATVSCALPSSLHGTAGQNKPCGRPLWVLPLLAAVLASVLATLLCIWHCHATAQVVETTRIAFLAPGGEALAVCHSPGGDVPGVPAPLSASMLRALYELAPALLVFCLPLLLLGFAWQYGGTELSSLVYLAPEPPPPRQVSCSHCLPMFTP